MQTDKLPLWTKLTGILFGLALVFIGGRFLLAPEIAERGFGIVYNQPDNAFHFIKGIRDLFSGLILLTFALADWRKPLAVATLFGSLIPVVDMVIVLTTPQSVPGAEWIHGLTAVSLWIFAFMLLRPSPIHQTAKL